MKSLFAALLCLVALRPLFAAEPAAPAAPDTFVSQPLDPIGGKIDRPKDWFFLASHRWPSLAWTISKEDSSKGRYDTGVRIQVLMFVHKNTGQSPQAIAAEILAAKRQAATKVIDECQPLDWGQYTRTCLEVEEGPYHVLYSIFAGNGPLDLVAIQIAGARREDWQKYAPVFSRMNRFQLLDPERIRALAAADTPADKPAAKPPAAAPRTVGFDVANLQLSYMSQNEYAASVSVNELSAYVNRLKVRFTALYAEDRKPRTFTALFCVHHGHAHVWLLNDDGTPAPENPGVAGQIAQVALPTLTKEPVVFALVASIAGAKPTPPDARRGPLLPKTWKDALARLPPSAPMTIADVVARLVPE